MQTYRPRELAARVDFITVWNHKKRFEKDEDTSPQWVLFVVDGGSFRFEIGELAGVAEKGDLLLCPPDIALKREMLRPATFLVLNFSWFAAAEEIRTENRLFPNPAGKHPIRDKQRFASTYGYLAMLSRRLDPLGVGRRNFLLADLWEQFDWEWETHLHETRVIPDDPLMEEAEAYIKENAFKSVSLSQLSSEMGLSTVQFSRRFRSMFGVNPSEYLSELRLDRARTLLQETVWTIDKIAAACGYSNGFYFSRVFSQKMGITPSEYRRAHRI
ncbi:AraC family transcriptional regulator [Paenibacillus sp. GYB004]|uniref:AraC family transcriptional regulator n=1 Tax=Paenibacillus sp. GYB004 TaxID=2994393 RepID=UPI002F96BE52